MAERYYRYRDVQYAASLDEFERPQGSGELKIHLQEYEVVKKTLKGVWIAPVFGSFVYSDRRFVLENAHKKFACSTIEAARESFIARKKRQINIHQSVVNRAKKAINLIEGKEIFNV